MVILYQGYQKKFQSLELYGFEQNELLANLAKKELKKS